MIPGRSSGTESVDLGGSDRTGADLVHHAPSFGPSRLPRDAARDAVQPRPDALRRARGVRLARQDEERGLERVLGVVPPGKRPATGREHHRPVAPDKFGKRPFVSTETEPGEQFGVRRVCVWRAPNPAR